MRPRYIQKLLHFICKTVKSADETNKIYITEGIIYNTFGIFFAAGNSNPKQTVNLM